MKIIDLLVKIANNEEVPKKIKYGSELFVFNETYKRYVNDDGETLGEFIAIDLCLNDEIEIVEEKPTYEQNFTGWQLIQNGKVVASYNAQRLKPADITVVEKDVKEMLEENPKKIEEIPFNNGMKGYEDIYHELEKYNYRINDLIRAVNYLLEKESDK